MKNKLMHSLLLFTCLCLVLGGCGKQESDTQKIDVTTKTEEKTQDKVGIFYFSCTGTTKQVATMIQEELDCDMYEIVPTDPYTEEDREYHTDDSRCNQEQNDNDSRPTIKDVLPIEDYDIIYLGYPIWWDDVPKIILTLLDTYDLSNKTVIPFCTSGSSSIDNSIKTLTNYKNDIHWTKGSRLTPNKDEITTWLQK